MCSSDLNNGVINRAKALILSGASKEEIQEEANKLQSIIDAYNTAQLEDYKSKAIDFVNTQDISDEQKKEYIDNINKAEDSTTVDTIKKEAEAKALELSVEEYKEKINEMLNISEDEQIVFNNRIDNEENAEMIYKEALNLDASNLKNGKEALLSDFESFRHIDTTKLKEVKDAFDLAETVEEAKEILDAKRDIFKKENDSIRQIKKIGRAHV